jgi:SgrR family transcriptional regulator
MEDYYIKLRKQYSDVKDEEPFEITLPELAELWQCTARNVNLVLRRMVEECWIAWEPGRGRGHRSRMTFLIKADAVALLTAQTFVRKGDLQQAFSYLEQNAHLSAVKDQFVYWLDTQFGFRPETVNEQTTDTLRLPYHRPIGCLDPAMLTFVVECHMIRQIFDNLVRYNEQNDSIEPGLAHYWSANKSNTEWVFYLRKGVYFHHGRELTAKDVRFTLNRLRQDEKLSPFRWLFEGVVELEVISTYVIRIRLREANPLFLHHLSYDRAAILPEDAVLELGEAFRRKPVGTGPFRVVQHDDNMLVLEAFSKYYEKRAHLDRIEVWYMPELDRKASHLEAPMYQMRYQDCRYNGEIPSGWNVVETVGRDCTYVTFNLSIPGPQQQLALRRALMHAIDRKELTSSQHMSAGDVTLAQWFFDQQQERSDTDGQYHPMLSKRLLDECGYQGEPLVFAISPAFYSTALVMAAQLERIGVRLELLELPAEHDERVRLIQTSHLSMCRNVMDHDLELSVIELFLAENSHVRSHLGSELQQQTDWLIHRLYQEGSPLTRSGYLRRLQQLIAEQAYILFLYHTTQRTVYHPSLKNVSLNSLGWVQFRDLWFEPTFCC